MPRSNTLLMQLRAVAAGFIVSGFCMSASAATLATVQARGEVVCGVTQGKAGFSSPDAAGRWTGLDVDLCRGIAAAVFGDPGKVRYVPLSAKDRFTSLQSGDIDVLSRVSTITLSRDASMGMNYTVVTYFDGQGFMTRASANVKNVADLNGASICTQQGTTTELNLADFFRSKQLKYEVVAFASLDDALKAFEAGRCDAITDDVSGLYSQRLKLAKPDDAVVLKEVISKEPLGPFVRQGDEGWFDIVKWTHHVMLDAEEMGITSGNIDEMRKSETPKIRRLLGVEGKFGEQLGLSNEWAYRIVKHVGNYGESFERNIGQGSLLKIDRGLNQLWTRGGLQYGLPVR